MKKPLFTGSGVAIVTPFTKETVDLPTLGKLLDFQMKNGTDAIIVCGTTGEASTMSYRERMRTIEFCVDHGISAYRADKSAFRQSLGIDPSEDENGS